MKTHGKPNLLGRLSIERCRNWNLNKKCQNRDILFKGFISRWFIKNFFFFFLSRYINSYVAHNMFRTAILRIYVKSSKLHFRDPARVFRGTPRTWVRRVHFARRLGREFAFTRRGIPRFLEVVKRECIIPQLARESGKHTNPGIPAQFLIWVGDPERRKSVHHASSLSAVIYSEQGDLTWLSSSIEREFDFSCNLI